jgi:hypothetical protein
MKNYNFLYILVFMPILFLITPENQQNPPTEEYAPDSKKTPKEMILQLPFHPKPTRMNVAIVNNNIVLEGDIIIEKKAALNWLTDIKQMKNAIQPKTASQSESTNKFQASPHKSILDDINDIADMVNSDIESLDLTTLNFPDDTENWVDYELAPDQNMFAAVAIKGSGYRWPKATIPYKISTSFSVAKTKEIKEAIKRINNKTNLTLIQRTSEYNYIHLVFGQGCASNVGMQRHIMGQEIIIGTGCDVTAIVHEICHSAGLYHEQSRSDRDKYVTIHWANIARGQESNFHKMSSDAFDIGTYDFESIMHYGPYAFTTNYSKPTISSKKGIPFGQRAKLSTGDITAINTLYPNKNPSKPNPTKPQPTVVNPSYSKNIEVTAAVNRGDGKNYFFFKDRTYTRYNLSAFKPDLNYPKAIRNNWPGVNWTNIDATAAWEQGIIVLFKGNEVIKYDTENLTALPGYPKSFRDEFGFHWSNIDAACVREGNKLYLFKGKKYIKYDLYAEEVEQGYPLNINFGWKGIPWDSVDAVLNWNDKKYYLFKGNEYIRYDMEEAGVDAGYPKKVGGNWPGL